jgi:hypothetical protein
MFVVGVAIVVRHDCLVFFWQAGRVSVKEQVGERRIIKTSERVKSST